jgi:shikimate dehydrogenase
VADGTRCAVVIGQPIEHSLSPVIHNAAFAQAGLDWHLFALTVPAGDAARAIAVMRNHHLAGMSVTMPHKDAVVSLVDECSPAAAALDAVNCVSWDGERLVGDNTDGPGLVDALRIDSDFDPAGHRAVVLGAGGAARAVVRALAAAGVTEVVVVNRTTARAEVAAALGGAAGRVGSPADIPGADLVVNATSVGMGGSGLPCDPALLHAGQLVVDLVYQPVHTQLLQAAADQGASVADGVGMLVHQAAHAFERWTGTEAPRAVMAAAARTELQSRG